MAKGTVLTPQEAVERGREYVEGYFDRVRDRGLSGEASPALFRGQPYEVHCHPLGSGGLMLLFKRDSKGSFRAVDREEMGAHSYDFSVYISKREAQSGEARSRGSSDADRDCALSQALSSLVLAREEANSILESTERLLKTNPWLDEYASSSLGASERLMRTLAEQSEALRRELASLASSHRSALTDLASGLAPLESAAVRDEALVLEVKSRLSDLEDEVDERWNKAAKDFAVLAEVARRVDTVADDLDALKLSKDSEESGGKKLKEAVAPMGQRLDALDFQVARLSEDVKVSEEIKDTLFRDSKRLHNMNERLNLLETETGESGLEEKVAELKKRLDAMERRMTTEINIAVGDALKASQPPVEETAGKQGKPRSERKKR
ncbi:MAG: hypothetical protein V1934_07475 [Methanobacteriota archaeon]